MCKNFQVRFTTFFNIINIKEITEYDITFLIKPNQFIYDSKDNSNIIFVQILKDIFLTLLPQNIDCFRLDKCMSQNQYMYKLHGFIHN